jgi:hypothetical protein
MWHAARLNPNSNPDMLFGPEGAEDRMLVDKSLIEAVKAEPPVLHPELLEPALDPVLSFALPRWASGQRRRLSVREQLIHYTSQRRRSVDQARPHKIDVIGYWIEKRNLWPELAAYALHLMTSPVSSSATERLFSVSVGIEGLKRQRLSPEHVQDLTLLKYNSEIVAEAILQANKTPISANLIFGCHMSIEI